MTITYHYISTQIARLRDKLREIERQLQNIEETIKDDMN